MCSDAPDVKWFLVVSIMIADEKVYNHRKERGGGGGRGEKSGGRYTFMAYAWCFSEMDITIHCLGDNQNGL